MRPVSLNLYHRLTTAAGTATQGWVGDFTAAARDWERTKARIGGYLDGSFFLSQEDLTLAELKEIYNTCLGHRLEETTYGMTSWEGLLYEFRLVHNGREYRRTLDPEWFHNKVKVLYNYPQTEDDEQGNLAYDPGGNDAFQDDGQDFAEWETAAGNAAYSVAVTNSDGTRAWGFMGAAFTTTNADDSVYVYTDVELNTAGWNGDTSGKTPSSYEVSSVDNVGSRLDTGWATNADAIAEYGQMEYVITLGGTAPEAAEAMRDRELEAFAWPRTRKMGGGEIEGGMGGGGEPAVLEIVVAGYWATLNWRYEETNRLRTASDMIEYLVGQSEFVTVGRVDADNKMRTKVDANPTPMRLGDAIEQVVLDGDLDGDVWQGGVYAGREFVYEEAPTDYEYVERQDGVLVDIAGVPVIPSMVDAGFLLLDQNAPGPRRPAGTSNVWDDPRIAYVDEVTWSMEDDRLEYHLLDQEESVAALAQYIRRGLRRINPKPSGWSRGGVTGK